MSGAGFRWDRDDWPVQILDDDGTVLDGASVPDLDDEELRTIYEEMRYARVLDERATSLHRQGRIGTYPPLQGQEAAQVASTHALADTDWLSFQYREHGAVVARGLSHEYLLYWMGHETGNAWLAEKNIFPINISIGSHLPHATGLAWAAKLRGDDVTVACHFGDGATSEGDFHEALNFAGVFDAPTIFICNNNQYAISVPRDRQTASATIAQKADAYGMPGVQVDGMDPLAVYAVTREAAERAKAGEPNAPRPSLIEAVMYRLGAHTTVDDPSNYREDDEVEQWREKDPIPRMERFLRDRGLLDDEMVAAIGERARQEIGELVDQAEAFASEPTAMFEDVYETPTPRVSEGRDRLEQLRERHGDDVLTRDE
ncbi:MAG: pyruvate dehydrogenase (acetyl-transferring) E1 component subunit alpha [Salinirussus sp.]